MAPKSRGRLAIPTTKPFPDSVRLPSSNRHVFKTLSRLSRPSLLSLAAEWCLPENLASCGPYILGEDEEEDEEGAFVAAQSLMEVEERYAEELRARKGSKREVVDYILEGDWRHGISLRQLAMAETQFLLDHPSSSRWTALRLARRGSADEDSTNYKDHLPRFHGQTFLRALQKEIAPISKAHCYLSCPKSYPITLLRIYLHESPYNTEKSFQAISAFPKSSSETAKSIFIIIPDGTPFFYVSVASAGTHLVDTDSRSLQQFAIEAIPKAFSRPNERYELRPTFMTARSLTALLAHRGAERTNNVAGGWSIFADDSFSTSALDYRTSNRETTAPLPEDQNENKENLDHAKGTNKRVFQHTDSTATLSPRVKKRLKRIAAGRFGTYGLSSDGKGLNRFDVRIKDAFSGPSLQSTGGEADDSTEAPVSVWKPEIRLSFQGSHVFAGLRQLVENGVIDGVKMPGWLTGEGSVSIGVVKDGRFQSDGKSIGI